MSRPTSIRELIIEQLQTEPRTATELAELLKLPARTVVTKISHMVKDGEVFAKNIPVKYELNKLFETVKHRQARLVKERESKNLEQATLKVVQGTYRADLRSTYQPPKESSRRI